MQPNLRAIYDGIPEVYLLVPKLLFDSQTTHNLLQKSVAEYYSIIIKKVVTNK